MQDLQHACDQTHRAKLKRSTRRSSRLGDPRAQRSVNICTRISYYVDVFLPDRIYNRNYSCTPFSLFGLWTIDAAHPAGSGSLCNLYIYQPIMCDAMLCFFVSRVEPWSGNGPPGTQRAGSFIRLDDIRETEGDGMDSYPRASYAYQMFQNVQAFKKFAWTGR